MTYVALIALGLLLFAWLCNIVFRERSERDSQRRRGRWRNMVSSDTAPDDDPLEPNSDDRNTAE